MSARQDFAAHYKAVRARMQPKIAVPSKPVLSLVAEQIQPEPPPKPEIIFVNDPPINLAAVRKRVTMSDVANAVSRHYGMSMIDLMSDRRTQPLARARQMMFCVAREVTLLSYPSMALAMNRDHTTAIHADRITRLRMQDDEQLRSDFEAICSAVRTSKGITNG